MKPSFKMDQATSVAFPLYASFFSLLNENSNISFSKECCESLSILRKAYDEYPHLYLSFNGGKDGTVLLHLMTLLCMEKCVIKTREHLEKEMKNKISILYFQLGDVFTEVDTFLMEMKTK